MSDGVPGDEITPAGGASALTEMLGVGSRIALDWGASCSRATIGAATGGRFMVCMDWGMELLMDMQELRRRNFVLLPRKRPFWKR